MEGVPVDAARAVKLNETAIERGNVNACYIAIPLKTGAEGVRSDAARAVKPYK